jgi:hypothetical protein
MRKFFKDLVSPRPVTDSYFGSNSQTSIRIRTPDADPDPGGKQFNGSGSEALAKTLRCDRHDMC